MNSPRIYVASSWRNPRQPAVVAELQRASYDVYDFKNPAGGTGFSWSSIDPNWQNWTPEEYIRALSHPLALAGFRSDMGALASCDACVLVLPCGRSAHLELGYAVGAGKYTVVLMEEKNEPELMALMCNRVVSTLRDVTLCLYQQYGLRG